MRDSARRVSDGAGHPDLVQIATPADLQYAARLVELCGETPRWPAEAWEELVACAEESVPRRMLFVTRGAGAWLTGLLAASLIEETAELELVLVSPAERRTGLGLLLLRGWLRWAKSHGATEALLEVRVSNGAALGLYRRLGFESQAVRRKYYREPVEDAVLMRLDLKGGPFDDPSE